MATDFLAANLRRLREARRLTQAQLAEAAGLSRVGYRNIESGDSEPRVATLEALAASLGVELRDLLAPVAELRQVRFRAMKRLNDRAQILAGVARWLDDFNWLEELLEEKPPSLDLQQRDDPNPEAAAAAARKKLKIGREEPIRDICGLLEARGIKVFPTRRASASFFGLSVGPGDGGPAVVVNTWERISVERWIFTAAHELGHLVLHPGDYDVTELVEEEPRELEANLFAAHFLMPDGVFCKEWQETGGLPFIDRVLKVKRIFRVSYKTVLYRLSNRLGGNVNVWARFQADYKRRHGQTLLKEEEPEALSADAFKASFPESRRSGEPHELSPADFREDRLWLLVRRAVESGAISLGRGAEILNLSTREMRALSSSWIGSA